MQYKFNRKKLRSLLLDSQKQYENGTISQNDYNMLKTVIKNLIYGEAQNKEVLTSNNIDTIFLKLNVLKDELGDEFIEKLLYLSYAIIESSSYLKTIDDSCKQASNDLVEKILKFYFNCDKQQFNYLNKFVHNKQSFLEFVSNNFINRKRFETSIQALPFYNLNFVRIFKENRLYDETSLCHELRHILDISKLNINSLDLNIFSETNPIAMEFYYEVSKLKENKNYKAGIIERVNYMRYMATQVNIYMNLLIQIDNFNHLTKRMIGEAFRVKTKKDFQNALISLNSEEIYGEISYFIGGLKGMHLCNIATTDLKSSLRLQDKICSIMVTEEFIPKNIENVLGKDFAIGENDITTYRQFVKKIKS